MKAYRSILFLMAVGVSLLIGFSNQSLEVDPFSLLLLFFTITNTSAQYKLL